MGSGERLNVFLGVVWRIAWTEWEGLLKPGVSDIVLEASGCNWIGVGCRCCVLEDATLSGLQGESTQACHFRNAGCLYYRV